MSKRVLLGVTGSIAAYKAAELVRLLCKAGCEVTVVMTAAATRFVAPLTFRTLSGNPVAVDMFPEPPPERVPHIALADWADALVVAPCTANVAAKLAHGIADDLLSCTALACDAPLVLAPAMNVRMWRHGAVTANLAVLRERGAVVLEVGSGELACGTEGPGRMLEPAAIADAVLGVLSPR